MNEEDLTCIITALILPTVQKDMGKEADDLLDVINEAAEYASDILAAVKGKIVDDDNDRDPDDGEKVEVIPPRRRHA